IIDAGWTALSGDRGTARQATDYGYGAVCDLSGRILPGLTVVEVNQEHGIVGLGQNFQGIAPKLPIGTRLRILPNHACATAEQHDRYHVLANEKIIAHWPRFRGW
ncbi:MAG: DSD1 family PLP-dependent enzyme, partial [Desulfovibrionales bacterium]|nr:DSD1 family PLP-dependent enzyme [Desulfovibrionales bacterium]